jgi:hypothetical protein
MIYTGAWELVKDGYLSRSQALDIEGSIIPVYFERG